MIQNAIAKAVSGGGAQFTVLPDGTHLHLVVEPGLYLLAEGNTYYLNEGSTPVVGMLPRLMMVGKSQYSEFTGKSTTTGEYHYAWHSQISQQIFGFGSGSNGVSSVYPILSLAGFARYSRNSIIGTSFTVWPDFPTSFDSTWYYYQPDSHSTTTTPYL